jgi:hypothetical protein
VRSKRPTHAEERIFNSTSLLTSKAQLFLLHLSWRVIAPLIIRVYAARSIFFCVFMQYPVAWSSSSSSSSLISSVCCWVRCSCRWRRRRRCLCWCCSTRRAMAAINASRGVEQQDSELRGQPGDTQHATHFWTHHPPSGFSRAHTRIFQCQLLYSTDIKVL